MKRTILLVIIVLLFTACVPTKKTYSPRVVHYGSETKATCEYGWKQMDVEVGNEGMIINLILNNNFPPDSVGAALKECINGGWEGWR